MVLFVFVFVFIFSPKFFSHSYFKDFNKSSGQESIFLFSIKKMVFFLLREKGETNDDMYLFVTYF